MYSPVVAAGPRNEARGEEDIIRRTQCCRRPTNSPPRCSWAVRWRRRAVMPSIGCSITAAPSLGDKVVRRILRTVRGSSCGCSAAAGSHRGGAGPTRCRTQRCHHTTNRPRGFVLLFFAQKISKFACFGLLYQIHFLSDLGISQELLKFEQIYPLAFTYLNKYKSVF